MGIDENKLYEAFRREADIPPELQQRLGRTYEQLRQLGRTERESTMPHKTTRRWNPSGGRGHHVAADRHSLCRGDAHRLY